MTRRVLVAGSSRRISRAMAVASMAAFKGYAYVGAYAAAKHAVLGLTRACAREFAGARSTVNTVRPGYTDMEVIAGSLDRLEQRTGRDREGLRAYLAHSSPVGRLIQPDKATGTALFLASPDGGINLQAIAVAGGET